MGIYIVQWISKPYTLQEEMDELRVGKLVCNAMYLNLVGQARNWYMPGTGEMIICIQHVVTGDIELLEPLEMITLPRTCHQWEAIQKGVLQLLDALHKEILDEINQRDVLTFK